MKNDNNAAINVMDPPFIVGVIVLFAAVLVLYFVGVLAQAAGAVLLVMGFLLVLQQLWPKGWMGFGLGAALIAVGGALLVFG
jgi:hypothetical protein